MRGEENVRVSPTSPVLKPFLNKLFLAKTAHQDSPYMNLCGADREYNKTAHHFSPYMNLSGASRKCYETAHQDSPYMNLSGADRDWVWQDCTQKSLFTNP